MNSITSFKGDYRFLSNFWPCTVELDGMTFPSVEHAYVAAKTLDMEIRAEVRACTTAADAKRYGRELKLRADWDTVKLQTMARLLEQKFSDPNLAAMLLRTGNAELVEGNTWGDTFWGVCKGVGHNHLGVLLMRIRAELRAYVESLDPQLLCKHG